MTRRMKIHSLWDRLFEPVIRPLLHRYWRLSRGMTLGVRALVIDGEGRILLVRHGYVAGWHLPGGGVERNETVLSALARELEEEARVICTAPPVLHGIFFNARVSRRDHVAVYIVRAFRQDGTPARSREIEECGFFAPSVLPDETTPGTRRRIAEVIDGASLSGEW